MKKMMEIYEDLYAESDYIAQNSSNPISSKKSNLKVLQHPNSGSYEVMIVEPRSFDESLEIVDNLREKKISYS